MKKEKTSVIILSHFMVVDGREVEIDPKDTTLPDICKLAISEMVSGKKHEFVSSP